MTTSRGLPTASSDGITVAEATFLSGAGSGDRRGMDVHDVAAWLESQGIRAFPGHTII